MLQAPLLQAWMVNNICRGSVHHCHYWDGSYRHFGVRRNQLRCLLRVDFLLLPLVAHVGRNDIDLADKVNGEIASEVTRLLSLVVVSTDPIFPTQSAVIWGLTASCAMAIITQLVFAEWQIWSWVFTIFSSASFACALKLVNVELLIMHLFLQKGDLF